MRIDPGPAPPPAPIFADQRDREPPRPRDRRRHQRPLRQRSVHRPGPAHRQRDGDRLADLRCHPVPGRDGGRGERRCGGGGRRHLRLEARPHPPAGRDPDAALRGRHPERGVARRRDRPRRRIPGGRLVRARGDPGRRLDSLQLREPGGQPEHLGRLPGVPVAAGHRPGGKRRHPRLRLQRKKGLPDQLQHEGLHGARDRERAGRPLGRRGRPGAHAVRPDPAAGGRRRHRQDLPRRSGGRVERGPLAGSPLQRPGGRDPRPERRLFRPREEHASTPLRKSDPAGDTRRGQVAGRDHHAERRRPAGRAGGDRGRKGRRDPGHGRSQRPRAARGPRHRSRRS